MRWWVNNLNVSKRIIYDPWIRGNNNSGELLINIKYGVYDVGNIFLLQRTGIKY